MTPELEELATALVQVVTSFDADRRCHWRLEGK